MCWEIRSIKRSSSACCFHVQSIVVYNKYVSGVQISWSVFWEFAWGNISKIFAVIYHLTPSFGRLTNFSIEESFDAMKSNPFSHFKCLSVQQNKALCIGRNKSLKSVMSWIYAGCSRTPSQALIKFPWMVSSVPVKQFFASKLTFVPLTEVTSFKSSKANSHFSIQYPPERYKFMHMLLQRSLLYGTFKE